ncbi:MAG: hypothetical protein ACM3PY_05360 [Omnitrophica WOR_2 bacterium]
MKKMILQILSISLLLGVLVFTGRSTVYAEEMTCPTPTPVTIDIKPGSYPNTIKLSSNGLVPVAVLTTGTFDASLFMPEMAHLNDASAGMAAGCTGAMAVRWDREDVNRDGRMDLVFFFRAQDLTLTTSSTAASLMAHGAYGPTMEHITGTDSVRVIP